LSGVFLANSFELRETEGKEANSVAPPQPVWIQDENCDATEVNGPVYQACPYIEETIPAQDGGEELAADEHMLIKIANAMNANQPTAVVIKGSSVWKENRKEVRCLE
jgi:hypothetical protein